MSFFEDDDERRERLLRESLDAARRQVAVSEKLAVVQQEEARRRAAAAEKLIVVQQEAQRQAELDSSRILSELQQARFVPEIKRKARRRLRAFASAQNIADPFESTPAQGSISEQDRLETWSAYAVAFSRTLTRLEALAADGWHTPSEARLLSNSDAALRAAAAALDDDPNAKQLEAALRARYRDEFDRLEAALRQIAEAEEREKQEKAAAETVRAAKEREQAERDRRASLMYIVAFAAVMATFVGRCITNMP